MGAEFGLGSFGPGGSGNSCSACSAGSRKGGGLSPCTPASGVILGA